MWFSQNVLATRKAPKNKYTTSLSTVNTWFSQQTLESTQDLYFIPFTSYWRFLPTQYWPPKCRHQLISNSEQRIDGSLGHFSNFYHSRVIQVHWLRDFEAIVFLNTVKLKLVLKVASLCLTKKLWKSVQPVKQPSPNLAWLTFFQTQ